MHVTGKGMNEECSVGADDSELLPLQLDHLIRSVLQTQQEELLQCMDAWLARQRATQAVRSSSQQELSTEFLSEERVCTVDGNRRNSETGGSLGNNSTTCIAEAFSEMHADAESEPIQASDAETVGTEEVEEVPVQKVPSRWSTMHADPIEIAESRAIYRLVQSWQFEALFACIIISNSLLIGVQVEYEATHLSESTLLEFTVISFMYTLLFTVELVLRMYGEGVKNFLIFPKSWLWNYLDVAIVVTSLLEVGIQLEAWLAQSESSELGISQTFRILRLSRTMRFARVFRVIKVIRFVQSVRTLCSSILSTMKPLVSSLFLLLLIIYVFGILFTDSVTSYRLERQVLGTQRTSEDAMKVLTSRFGSLYNSMNTLFRSMSNGLDWDIVAGALETVSWAWTIVFTAFIIFCCFAVLNVMTARFCQSAMESSQRDLEQASEKQTQRETLRRLFDWTNGVMTLGDLEGSFAQPEFKECMIGLELEPNDARTLFGLLDKEKTNQVDVEAFIDGCTKLKSTIKAIDIVSLQLEGKSVRKTVEQIEMTLQKLESSFDSFMASLKNSPSLPRNHMLRSHLNAVTPELRDLIGIARTKVLKV